MTRINLLENFKKNTIPNKYNTIIKNPTFNYINIISIDKPYWLEYMVEYIVFWVLTMLITTYKPESSIAKTIELDEKKLDFINKSYISIVNKYRSYLLKQWINEKAIDSLFWQEKEKTTLLAVFKKVINIYYLSTLDIYAKLSPEYFTKFEYIKKIQSLLYNQLTHIFYSGRFEYFIWWWHMKLYSLISQLKTDDKNAIRMLWYNFKLLLDRLFKNKDNTWKKTSINDTLEKTFENLKIIEAQYIQNHKQIENKNLENKEREEGEINKKEKEVDKLKELMLLNIKTLWEYWKLDTNIWKTDNEFKELYLNFISKNNLIVINYNSNIHNKNTIIRINVIDFNIKSIKLSIHVNMMNKELSEYNLWNIDTLQDKELSWIQLFSFLEDVYKISKSQMIDFLLDAWYITEKNIEIWSISIQSDYENIIHNEDFKKKDKEEGIIDWDNLLNSSNNKILKKIRSSYAETFEQVEDLLNFEVKEKQITEYEKKQVLQEILHYWIKKKFKHIFYDDIYIKKTISSIFNIRKYVNIDWNILAEVSRKINLSGNIKKKRGKLLKEIKKITWITSHYSTVKYKYNIYIVLNWGKKKIGTLTNKDPIQLTMFNIDETIDNALKYFTDWTEETLFIAWKMELFLK